MKTNSTLPTSTTGYLMAIGGAEDKTGKREILKRFIELSGGQTAHIVVVPTASSFPIETGRRYYQIFTELGAASVNVLDINERREANSPTCASLLDGATGIFLGGGDQVKLLALIGGTLIEKKIRQRYAAGATVAGTSAGASSLSLSMIAFGRSGAKPSQRMVNLAPGLGLIDCVTIDQHFTQRDRLGRLMTAVAYHPGVLGVGVDENTAFIIGPEGECEVYGAGAVTVVDGTNLEVNHVHLAKRHDPIRVEGMTIQRLTAGECYHILTREVLVKQR